MAEANGGNRIRRLKNALVGARAAARSRSQGERGAVLVEATIAIIFVLLKSRCRFATLRDAIPDITDRMLSDRLQELEAEEIVERTVIPDTPVRVEYSLTKKGRALAVAFDAIAEWAHKWTDEAPAPKRAVKRA